MSGVAHLNGDIDGRPRLVGTAVGDTVGGAHAFGAICAALYKRAVTNRGEYIDLSLVDALIWQNEWAFEYRLLSGGQDLPKKSRPVVNVHGIYKARDGYITLAAVTQDGWENLTRVIGKPELASDPRFLTPRDREVRWKEVDAIIEDWVMAFPSARAAVHAFTDVGGLVGSEVLSVPDVLEDPRLEEQGMLAEVGDPVLGPVKVLNSPFKFAGSTSGARDHAPLRGEHTVTVLRDLLGLSRERVLESMAEGAVLIEDRAVDSVLKEIDL
jgi:crotonobetainyl-CoA:carnitine CoA-transferase CaiB-like acyl-CoA transferase